ncbi:MAG: methionyl-tRNA formyltransferase [Candidatus Eremiobacteraeota bacterium]|nr:methionyl-tRNA formyltransferase [Candidatus Eremiobacteraeota bacterium]
MRAFAAAAGCVLVVTQPDRPAKRGQKMLPTPVKNLALELDIPTLEPESLKDFADALGTAKPDLVVVASYGKIVPQTILDLAPLGALNIHPSLLPLYRGATPLQAQLRDGVTTGGVSIILMDAGMDTGDIVLQERRDIAPDETYGELHDRFAALGAEMLAQACADLGAGTLVRTPQRGLASDEAIAATLTRPLRKEDLELDWNWPAERIVNFVRSLSPIPGARAELAGERVKILRASVYRDGWRMTPGSDGPPGSLWFATEGAGIVTTGDGQLAVQRLVPPSRPPMDGAAFALAKFLKAAAQ